MIPEYRYLILFPYKVHLVNGERKAELIPIEELASKYPRIWEYLNISEVRKSLKGESEVALKVLQNGTAMFMRRITKSLNFQN